MTFKSQKVRRLFRSLAGRASDRRLGVETERSGHPHRESKPSAHRHRTARIARTTRQINGAIDFGGWGELRRFGPLTAGFTKCRPELLVSFWRLLIHFIDELQWFRYGHV